MNEQKPEVIKSIKAKDIGPYKVSNLTTTSDEALAEGAASHGGELIAKLQTTNELAAAARMAFDAVRDQTVWEPLSKALGFTGGLDELHQRGYNMNVQLDPSKPYGETVIELVLAKKPEPPLIVKP